MVCRIETQSPVYHAFVSEIWGLKCECISDLEARETAAKVKEEASNKPAFEQHKNHLKKDAAKLLEQEV